MDISSLANAYGQLTRAGRALAAQLGDERGPEAAGWLIAHIACYDDVLAAAATRLADGLPVVVDNAPAMCMSRLAALIADHDFGGLLRLVEQTAGRVLAAVAAIPPGAADRLVQVRLTNRAERRVFDEPLPWSEVIAFHAEEQVPAHAAALQRLARPCAYRGGPRRTGTWAYCPYTAGTGTDSTVHGG